MRNRNTCDDISVIILFFHIKKHQKSLAVNMEPAEICAFDDSRLKVEESEKKFNIPRCQSDVSSSVHSWRQTVKGLSKTSIMEVFPRDSSASVSRESSTLPVSNASSQ